MQTIALNKPVTFDGKEYTKLELDFDSLTGRELMKAEAEAKALNPGGFAPVLELSKPYQVVVAAKAAKVPADVIIDLSGSDYTKVTVAAQNFLLG